MVKLWQPNLNTSLRMTTVYILLGLLVGFLYHTRFGYELLTPLPPPSPKIPPEAREGVVPKVCVGYLPDSKLIGYRTFACPKNHAYFSNKRVGGDHKSGPGRYALIVGNCCPLPADDILTDRHSYNELESCPDQYVVTGGDGNCTDKCTMRCTQINTKKYRLGPPKRAYYYKHASAGRLHGQGDTKRIFWEQIPAAIRYGIGRQTHKFWENAGCIGVPIGSLLTKKMAKRCDGFYYRELQYRDGVPVKMFPDCHDISDPYSDKPICLSEGEVPAVQPIVITR